jgi:DeoR/GlpR family transcriptional regulator of sugar metabolism
LPQQSLSAVRASFLEKLDDPLASEKRAIGQYIAEHLVQSGETIFVVSGTTVAMVAEAIMRTVRNAAIVTNSAPVLWSAMTLAHRREMANEVTVRTIKGELNLVTGIVFDGKLPKLSFDTLIYSPHGVSARGLVGNRDVAALQAVFRQAQRVLIPVTEDKIGAEASRVVKHFGHMAKEIKKDRRQYNLIYGASERITRQPALQQLLQNYATAGVKVIAIPCNA